jgi:hypothetical protein
VEGPFYICTTLAAIYVVCPHDSIYVDFLLEHGMRVPSHPRRQVWTLTRSGQEAVAVAAARPLLLLRRPEDCQSQLSPPHYNHFMHIWPGDAGRWLIIPSTASFVAWAQVQISANRPPEPADQLALLTDLASLSYIIVSQMMYNSKRRVQVERTEPRGRKVGVEEKMSSNVHSIMFSPCTVPVRGSCHSSLDRCPEERQGWLCYVQDTVRNNVLLN